MPQLVRRVGADAAAQLYESFIADLVGALPRTPYAPCLYALDNVAGFRERFPGAEIRPQRGSSEGRRLEGCFQDLLAVAEKAVVIGSSLPDLHPRMLHAAFEMLDRREVVVGPTERGGFYLLGMREPRDIFRGVRWGTGTELVTLLRNVERAGLDYGFFPTRQKVERPEDLVALRRRLLPAMAPLTHSMLEFLRVGEPAKEAG